jgi:hypothetical protein
MAKCERLYTSNTSYPEIGQPTPSADWTLGTAALRRTRFTGMFLTSSFSAPKQSHAHPSATKSPLGGVTKTVGHLKTHDFDKEVYYEQNK